MAWHGMANSMSTSTLRLHTLLLPPQTIHTLLRSILRRPVWLLFIRMSRLPRKIHIVCLLPRGPTVLMSMLASLLRLKSFTKLRPLASVLPLRVVTAGDGRYVEVVWNDWNTNLLWITPTLPSPSPSLVCYGNSHLFFYVCISSRLTQCSKLVDSMLWF